MKGNKNVIGIFWGHFTSMFIASIIAVSIAGWLSGGTAMEYSGLLRLGNEGLAFSSIAQLFAWSIVLSFFTTLLTSDVILKKVMLLWRVVVLVVLGIAITVVFAVLFRWLPSAEWLAWTVFLTSFSVPFGGGLLGGVIAATKVADKKYNKKLSEYKANKNKKEEQSK